MKIGKRAWSQVTSIYIKHIDKHSIFFFFFYNYCVQYFEILSPINIPGEKKRIQGHVNVTYKIIISIHQINRI